MIVHVTKHCNFRCGHCFIDFTSPCNDLSLEQYQSLAKQVGKFYWLDIGGGEPFLRNDLVDIIAAFQAKVVNIPSNGSLCDVIVQQLTELRQRTKAELCISLSVDGLEKTHNTIRRNPRSWRKVWQTYEQVRRLDNIIVKINTVINKQNYREIIELMKVVKQYEPDFHSIILLRGNPGNQALRLPSLEELRLLAADIFTILSTYNYAQGPFSAHILRNYHKYLWNISLKTLEEQIQVIPCLAGSAHMVVMADGAVSSCEMLTKVGDISKQTWVDIMESKAFKEQRQFIKDKKCYCTHNCAMIDSIFLNPAIIPKLLFQRIK